MYIEKFKQLLLRDENRGKSSSDYYLIASSDDVQGLLDELEHHEEIRRSELPEWIQAAIAKDVTLPNMSTPATMYGYALIIRDIPSPVLMRKVPESILPFDD